MDIFKLFSILLINYFLVQSKRYQKFIGFYFLFLLIPFLGVGIFNWIIDPLAMRPNRSQFNQYTAIIDTRLQKTLRLNFKINYDTVIIGSSRTELVNQNNLFPLKAFNYAAPSMYPNEYLEFIQHFSRVNGNPKLIIIGVDFFGSRKFLPDTIKSVIPSEYTNNCSVYKLFSLYTSLDSVEHSIKTIIDNLNNFPEKHYEFYKWNIKYAPRKDKQIYEQHKKAQIDYYRQNIYDQSYLYNKSLFQTWQKLKNQFPDSDFIVFTSPVSKEMYDLMLEMNLYKDYQQWLKDLEAVFGKVHNLMENKQLKESSDSFMDAHHVYPDHITNLIRQIIPSIHTK